MVDEAQVTSLPPENTDPSRGVGLDGEPSEQMTPSPDEAPPASDLVAGKDYPVGSPQIILAGAWVRLADTARVRAADDRAVGHIARVSFAPVLQVQEGPLSPRPYEEQAPDAMFTVETRDELNLIIPGLTREDFSEVGTSGRHEVAAHG